MANVAAAYRSIYAIEKRFCGQVRIDGRSSQPSDQLKADFKLVVIAYDFIFISITSLSLCL